MHSLAVTQSPMQRFRCIDRDAYSRQRIVADGPRKATGSGANKIWGAANRKALLTIASPFRRRCIDNRSRRLPRRLVAHRRGICRTRRSAGSSAIGRFHLAGSECGHFVSQVEPSGLARFGTIIAGTINHRSIWMVTPPVIMIVTRCLSLASEGTVGVS